MAGLHTELLAYYDVLSRFKMMYAGSALSEYRFSRVKRKPGQPAPSFLMDEVRVPLSLNLRVYGMVGGLPASGGVVIQLSRSISDDIRAALAMNVATLIHHGLSLQQPDLLSPLDPTLCLCLEVPSVSVVTVPADRDERLAHMESVSEQIARYWSEYG